MKTKYRKLMNNLILSESFIQDMEEKLRKPVKHKKPALRTTLIAACVGLLVVTTALAASQHFADPVSVASEKSGTDQSSYTVRAELEQKALSSLSSQLQADLDANKIQQIYYEKEALEKYLGFELVNSTGLEKAGIVEDLAEDFSHNWNLVPELAIETSARYILTAPDPETLKVSAHRVIHNTEVYLRAHIVVGDVQKDNLIVELLGESFSPITKVDIQLQMDDNGQFMRDLNGNFIVKETIYESAEQEFSFENYTMSNGCTATIITATEIDLDGARGFKQYMGYFIHDGILYTVKPYAIYDPYQSFPMNDYDCLTVMYEVLDLFE